MTHIQRKIYLISYEHNEIYLPFDEKTPFMTNFPSTVTKYRIPHSNQFLDGGFFQLFETQHNKCFPNKITMMASDCFGFRLVSRHQKIIAILNSLSKNKQKINKAIIELESKVFDFAVLFAFICADVRLNFVSIARFRKITASSFTF